MQKTTLVKQNLYSDSVSLMRMSNQVSALDGIDNVLVGMATDLNKELLENMGAMTPEAADAGPNDLIIAIVAENDDALQAALNEIDGLFARKRPAREAQGEAVFESIREVAELGEGYNMAVISVPGAYAARECRAALENDINVFLFSDNVSVEDEIRLKDIAHERRLLMMGPDCGTAIVGGVPLGFANVVRRGDIGIVAASGTGLQHVTTLIDNMGAGITHAIGVGGRDLSVQVGGRTMMDALAALGEDAETKVVVILSKPPAPEVAGRVLQKAGSLGKPVVLCLFGHGQMENLGGIVQCFNIEDTARKAVSLSTGREAALRDPFFSMERVNDFQAVRRPEQRYVRGIFGGGTVCDEAMITFRRKGIPIHSNIPLAEDEGLADVHQSIGNTFIDMGDDYFTRGKPHPMIDPSLRNKRIVHDALLPDTAVMLLDIELGYGSHPDPAGVAVQAAREAREKLGNRQVLWIASVIGTQGDPQGYRNQIDKLLEAGFVVTESNVRAAELAASLIAGKEEGR